MKREPAWIDDSFAYFHETLPAPRPKREPTKEEKISFYCLALSQSWLPPGIRNLILREMGCPPRLYATTNQRLKAWIAWPLVKAKKAEMKAKGDHPRGGRHEAAIEEVARRINLTGAGLKQLYRRHGNPGDKFSKR